MLKLYTYFRSSAAFRVRIALNLKGLSWEPEVIWLPDGEQAGDAYRAVNPQGLVPLLVDGDQRIAQSLAIIEYLDETKPGPKLLPADPQGRARVRSLAMLIAADIHPLNNLRVLNYLRQSVQADKATVDTWYRHWCTEGLAGYERQLADGRAGRFSHGDEVSLADVCLVPQIFNARRFETPLAAFPRTLRVFDECMKLEAFQKALPEAQPEAARAA
ncbi:MAG: maleylacetoacetate isomerase [Burkholderiales bacterium]|nr:maleylacetoacetate isomerase [Burkholderiales bacterium]